MREWKFQSSSSPKVYTTQINPTTNLLSCDCPGWTVKKIGKTRECKHTKKVIADEGLQIEERNEQQFVVSGAISKTPGQNAPRTTLPPVPESPISTEGFINPMLASKMPEGRDADFYSTPDYIMEEKFDGHRIVVRVEKEQNLGYHGGSGDNIILPARVTAWSRLGNPRTLPDHLVNLLMDMPDGVYDGELIVPGQHSYDVTEGQNSGTEKLMLFDMMEVLGKSIMGETLSMRREFLMEAYLALPDKQASILLTIVYPPSMARVQTIWNMGGEGTIIKRLSSKYQPGWRTPDWIKVKTVNAATLTIIGFETGKNGPYSVVRLRDDAGIETTVKTLDNNTLRQITKNPSEFIGKRLVISYHEKMPSGKYRHPMWDHLAGVGE